MKCRILHETKGRLRVHLCIGRMTLRQADLLEYSMRAVDGVSRSMTARRTPSLNIARRAAPCLRRFPRFHSRRLRRPGSSRSTPAVR